MSGALPPTPPPAFEKAGPKLFYGKVLWGEQRAVNIEYSVFARPAYCLLGNVFMLFSGRCPEPHDLLKKRDQNFSTEKFLRCEQRAVNTEYSVSASNRLRFGRTASGSGKNLSVLADFVLIKPVCFISAEGFRLRRNIFNKIRFCFAKAYLLKKLIKN